MQRGNYIVFEGIDGAGKSTLIHKLKHYLMDENKKVITTAEPTSNPIGSMIRHVLSGRIDMSEKTIAALFLADRLDHLQNKENGILKHLDEGYTVIGDRYYLSSYAYHVPHVSLDWVIEANSLCAQLLRPAITFFIDISVEESLKRISAGRQELDRFENEERITRVHANYKTAMDAVRRDENLVVINGMQDIENVFNDILPHLLKVL